MTQPGSNADTVLVHPVWALVAVADATIGGHLALALHHQDLASVPVFDVPRLLLHLDNPHAPDFAVVIIDSHLVGASSAPDSLPKLVTAVRQRTAAPVLTVGVHPPHATSGAHANLPPDTPPDAIAATSRAAVATARQHSSANRHWSRLRLDHAAQTVYWNSDKVQLTEHQFLILDTLIAAQGATVSYRQLARAIYGHNNPGDQQRIRAHIARLRLRFSRLSPTAAEIIGTGHRVGYRLIPPPSVARVTTPRPAHQARNQVISANGRGGHRRG